MVSRAIRKDTSKLCKNMLLWQNNPMSLLELQTQAEQLPFHERAALIRHLRHSLTDAEREALMLEQAVAHLDELQSGAVQRVNGDEWFNPSKKT